MEKLFSKQDIEEIEKDAADHLSYYLDALVVNGDANERTIMTISKGKRLVIVTGNGDTGWEHLRSRHAPYTFHNYWKPNDQGLLKLDNPGKFHPGMRPIIDYVRLADDIFTEANRNEEKNKRPELFDMFTESYVFGNEQPEKYHLFVYKGTKIVHTLYPHRKNNNPKNKTKFAKGSVTASSKLPEAFFDLRIPYLNEKDQPAFSILLRKSWREQIERIMIVLHDEQGEDKEYFLLGLRQLNGPEQFGREEMEAYQFSDLPGFEKLIDEITRTGKICSMEAPKISKSDFDICTHEEFEISFEIKGVKRKATVQEHYTSDEVYYVVTNICIDGSEDGSNVYDKDLTILPILILPGGETEWIEKGTERPSKLVTAIGRSIQG